ncbi:MAG: SpoIIE family protein phosphatase [bacterium]|nr:SpoIIE family protein phosphatase [bacterium]
MKLKITGLIIVLLLLPSGMLFSLSNAGQVRFKHISLEEGLSQTYVLSILEDSKGFMWFGTQDGLNKYDGYGFTIYRPDPDDPHSISHNTINVIYEDSRGVLWIGTNNGLERFHREKEEFFHYRGVPGDQTTLSHNGVLSVYEDRQGSLWVGTLNGLNRLDRATGHFTRYLNFRDSRTQQMPRSVSGICEDPSGKLWICSYRGGLHRFNPQDETFTYFEAPSAAYTGFGTDIGSSLFIDHSGTFWLGTTAGVYLFDPGTGQFTGYTFDADDPASLSHNAVRRIFEDHSGVLWVGTQGGLNRFDRRNERFIRYLHDPDDPSGLSSNDITSIYESRSGTLWIGTKGGGINKFDRLGERFVTYRSRPGKPGSLSGQSVFSIYQDSQGTLWASLLDNGLDRIQRSDGNVTVTNYRNVPGDPTSLGGNNVGAIHEDGSGRLWLGVGGSALHQFDPKTGGFSRFPAGPENPFGLVSNNIMSILEDRSGLLWFGTGNGISVFNPQTGTFTRYRNQTGSPDVLGSNGVREIIEGPSGTIWAITGPTGFNKFNPAAGTFTRYNFQGNTSRRIGANRVQSIREDRQGIIWLSSFGDGLVRFDPANETFKNYREKDGLPNNVVYGVLEDSEGYLWVSTNNGLSRFDSRTGTFKNYTMKDGLQSNEFNDRAFFRSPGGEMFFGGIDGISSFYPKQLEDNRHLPPIVITNFTVSNTPVTVGPGSILSKHISETSEIILSHKHNVFSFEFVALDYTIPEKNQYAYMMEGFDEDWNYTSSNKRFATYTNLDPGDYVFRVKGSNNDEVWNEEGVSVRLTITPPITRTWWFQLLAGFLVTGTAVFAYKHRMKELAQQTRLKAELQTARDAQMSIMPQKDPNVPVFEISGTCVPASEVGGDFFTYLWLDEEKTRFGIAIGDVSGKAMKAAMTAVMSDGILFCKASETGSIQEIMTRTNRPLYLKTDKRMFTALLLVALDTRTLEMTFSNAGLNHPILKSGASVTPLIGEGSHFPLGVLKDNDYMETDSQLKRGDVLVLLTDGIPDTQNAEGEFYENHTVHELLAKINTSELSATRIKEMIIADARAFAGSAPQNDDMTVVVVKVN